jgi:hypothetical protein
MFYTDVVYRHVGSQMIGWRKDKAKSQLLYFLYAQNLLYRH